MLYSAEARWFFNTGLPAEVGDWFLEGRTIEPESRTDRYLIFPGCDCLGVKLRESDDANTGAFEVKALIGAPEITRFSPRATARTDAWVKWTCSTEAFPDWVEAILASESSWVTIQKHRSSRRFSLDGNGCAEVPKDSEPKEGCDVEIVTLQVDGDPWWTFGFESFGPRETVRPSLHAVATRWFERDGPCTFGVVQSLSYATWVAGFVGSAAR
jgi:hypothetical protein